MPALSRPLEISSALDGLGSQLKLVCKQAPHSRDYASCLLQPLPPLWCEWLQCHQSATTDLDRSRETRRGAAGMRTLHSIFGTSEAPRSAPQALIPGSGATRSGSSGRGSPGGQAYAPGYSECEQKLSEHARPRLL